MVKCADWKMNITRVAGIVFPPDRAVLGHPGPDKAHSLVRRVGNECPAEADELSQTKRAAHGESYPEGPVARKRVHKGWIGAQ